MGIQAILLISLLTGCGEVDNTIHFKKSMIIDYGSNQSTCSLIDKIGSKKVSKKMIKKNEIVIGNFQVKCGKIDTSTLGSYTITFTTNNVEKREIIKQVLVKDISAPVILLKKEKVTIYSDEIDQLNLFAEDLINIKDNSDPEPTLSISGDTLSEYPGKYIIKITAIDKNKNRSTKKLTVIVKEKKKEVKDPIDNHETSGPTNNQNPSNNEQNPDHLNEQTPPSNNAQKPAYTTKDFLFSQGYNMNNVYSACSSELLNSSRAGTCQPLRNSENIMIGMRLTFY